MRNSSVWRCLPSFLTQRNSWMQCRSRWMEISLWGAQYIIKRRQLNKQVFCLVVWKLDPRMHCRFVFYKFPLWLPFQSGTTRTNWGQWPTPSRTQCFVTLRGYYAYGTSRLIFPRWDVIAIILSIFLLTYTYIEAKSNYHRGSILILRYRHIASRTHVCSHNNSEQLCCSCRWVLLRSTASGQRRWRSCVQADLFPPITLWIFPTHNHFAME